MPTYRSILVRTYSVIINADDEESAAKLSELFVGANDCSRLQDRERLKFEIQEIDLIDNNVIETISIE